MSEAMSPGGMSGKGVVLLRGLEGKQPGWVRDVWARSQSWHVVLLCVLELVASLSVPSSPYLLNTGSELPAEGGMQGFNEVTCIKCPGVARHKVSPGRALLP